MIMKRIFVIVAAMLLAACGKDDDFNGGYIGFDCLPDPAGTIISTCSSSGRSTGYVTFTPEATTRIYFDDNNIMECDGGEFVIVGRVEGLAAITSIPNTDKWAEEVSVVPGYGYIQRYKASSEGGYVYCRLYCIYSEGAVGSNGGRIVNVFKHQSPFIP